MSENIKKKKEKKDKKIEFRVNDVVYAKFLKMAREQDKSVSQLCRELLDLYTSVVE